MIPVGTVDVSFTFLYYIHLNRIDEMLTLGFGLLNQFSIAFIRVFHASPTVANHRSARLFIRNLAKALVLKVSYC